MLCANSISGEGLFDERPATPFESGAFRSCAGLRHPRILIRRSRCCSRLADLWSKRAGRALNPEKSYGEAEKSFKHKEGEDKPLRARQYAYFSNRRKH